MRSILILLCFASSVVGTAALADDISELRKLLDPVQTLTGSFEQTISTKKGELVQETTGKFAIERPGYFLWESAAPFEQTIVGSPEKLWIYDPDLEQLTVRHQNINDNNSPAKILSGNLDALKSSFDVTKSISNGVASFTLIPKDAAQANYQNVKVSFTKELLQSISFIDKLDQTTQVVFTSVKSNVALADSTFKFVPPPGTDIISDEQ